MKDLLKTTDNSLWHVGNIKLVVTNLQPNKKTKTDHLSAITLAYLKESKKPKRQDEFKRLREFY